MFLFFFFFFFFFVFNKFLIMWFYSYVNEGTQMAQSRYLFAISCFQMDLLNEAEAALCPPANDPNAAEVVFLILQPQINNILNHYICLLQNLGRVRSKCNTLDPSKWWLPCSLLSVFFSFCRFQMVQLVITFLGLFTGCSFFSFCFDK